MPRIQTIVQLTDELVERLDVEARRRRSSRSALIREAVLAYLASSSEITVAQQIVEGYERVPQQHPDQWGDPDDQAERSTVETLQRLDAEERRGESW